MRNITRIDLPEKLLKDLGLKRDPFLPPQKVQDIFYGTDASLLEIALQDTVNRPGICAVSGEVGSGKTLLVEYFRQTQLMPKKQYLVSRCAMHRPDQVRTTHLCKKILYDFRGDLHQYKELVAIAEAVRRAIEDLAENDVRPVILIEDAHLLPFPTLRDLKTLYEIADRLAPKLALILVGQPELKVRLDQENLRQLTQRCRLYEMKGLKSDLGQYVRHLFQRAGANAGDLFEPEAFKALASRYERGIAPLEANHLCAMALILIWREKEPRVTREIMLDAISLRDKDRDLDVEVATATAAEAPPRKAASA